MKASPAVEPLLIHLGNCFTLSWGTGNGNEERSKQGSEGDLQAWQELLVERHIIEPQHRREKSASCREKILISGGIDHFFLQHRGISKLQPQPEHCWFIFLFKCWGSTLFPTVSKSLYKTSESYTQACDYQKNIRVKHKWTISEEKMCTFSVACYISIRSGADFQYTHIPNR